MASSSNYNFEGSDDENFDQLLDQQFDQLFDQTFENMVLAYGGQEEERPERKNCVYIERNREADHIRLWNDYFSETPTYPENLFRRRFRMNRRLFMHIIDRLSNEVHFFLQKKDGLVRLGLSTLQKCTAAIRVLAYGTAADTREFPGMIGSIDCMHWEWENCPTAWKGQYSRGSGKPTIVLEAVASYDLWIWHAFFGPPGTLNDINVLDRSPVFDDILNGQAPQVTYSVNGREHQMAYYLTDGPKAVLFVQRQEVARKDVERAFGVLQACFAIVKNLSLFGDKVKIGNIMRACIILHNMIVEDERDGYTQFNVSEFQQGEDAESSHVDLTYPTDMPSNIANMMGLRTRIRDKQMHQRLKSDLVEHIWRKFGRDEDNN
uniref:DDE Tnp4 domain-containing protein n=1 Tax=Brassica oleracea var. oleracea TaxID=109376 RepID=A0A0D3C389_BRAOL